MTAFTIFSAFCFWAWIACKFWFHGLVTYHHHSMDFAPLHGRIIYWGTIFVGGLISTITALSFIW